ncbi:MAG: caspase family protein [Nannocystaceae bacterium]
MIARARRPIEVASSPVPSDMYTSSTRWGQGAFAAGGVLAALFGAAIAATPIVAEAAPSASAPAIDAPPLAQGTRRFALVVGVNNGGQERARLRYAGSDAQSLARALSDLGGVDPDNRVILVDPDAEALRRGFDRVAQRVRGARALGERVELIFYYSGHSDETGLLIGGDRIEYRTLRTWIDQVPADVRIGILDSCASGAFTRLKGGTRRAPFLIGGPSVQGHAFLTSSSADEAAQESDRVRGSFFTHYLVTGLRGAADINNDRLVTLNEAYRFAFDETLARTEGSAGGPQHAAYEIQLAGTGDLVMTDLRQTTARVEMSADLGGRVFIRDAQGNLEAELLKDAGAGPITLALEPGVYSITVDDGARLLRATITLKDGEAALLSPTTLAEFKAEPTVKRGDAGPPPAAAPAPEALTVPRNIGVSPKYSINGRYPGKAITNNVSLSLGVNRVWRIEGVDLALGANVIDGELLGLQAAGGLSRVHGRGRGVQGAIGVNLADDAFDGVQWSYFINRTRGPFVGLQFTGGVNVADTTLRGVQIGGLASVSEETRGLQLGTVNVAGSLTGVQIGVVNVTRGRARGAQFGLVNYADDADASFALLPITRKAGVHLDVWTSDLAALNLGLRLSARRTYALFTAGAHPAGPGAGWLYGLGFGGRFRPHEKIFIDLDNIVYGTHAGFTTVSIPKVVDSLRLMIGWQPVKRFSIYGGPTVNVAVDPRGLGEHARPGYAYRSYSDAWVGVWPGFVLGVSI